MFCFPSTHAKVAARIDLAQSDESKLQIVKQYLDAKLGQRKFSLDEKITLDPVLDRLNKKFDHLKENLKVPCDAVLEQAYTDSLCKIMSIKQEAWQQLKLIQQKYNMSLHVLRDLLYLIRYDIRVVVDDSKSMNDPKAKGDSSRWDELRTRIQAMAEIATCLDNDGINLYFLNTEPKIVRNVRSLDDVMQAFNRVPNGYTPIREALEVAMFDKEDGDKPILMVIATDGNPTDDVPHGCPGYLAPSNEGQVFVITDNSRTPMPRLEKVLTHCMREVDINSSSSYGRPKKANVKFSVMLCASGKDVELWNDLDRRVPNLDVNCDYASEAQEVLRQTKREYTFGNYQGKVLLGPIIPAYDAHDEPALIRRPGA